MAMKFRVQWKRHSVLPGFGLTMGFSLMYLSLIVLIPVAALFLKSAGLSGREFCEIVTDPEAIASYKLTFGASLAAGTANAFFGLIVAWVLVRYPFPGKRFVDAMVDIPFAMPTAVSGIALATIFSDSGCFGKFLHAAFGITVVRSPVGILIALTFIGLPFVVRTLQPALEDMEAGIEEAAASLGATRLQTFLRVILPAILPAWLTGFALACARALGEYGSVVFIASNKPFETETIPLLIVSKVGNSEFAQAAAVAVVALAASFAVLLFINFLQWYSRRYAN
jgi:sulfate/thiosulfate transport system permease protein